MNDPAARVCSLCGDPLELGTDDTICDGCSDQDTLPSSAQRADDWEDV